jgi:toxin ParE1/3/4
MSRVIVAPQAEEDLFEIAFHIAQDNPKAAVSLLERIERICGLIAASPEIGRRRREFGPELRSFPVDRYLVFYRPVRGGVEIARVLHGARDLPSLF